ncbi:hydrolase [Pseudomonadota bacterium]
MYFFVTPSLRGEIAGFHLIIQSSFKPAWWLRNRHAQTIWPSLFRRCPELSLYRERLELPDGDFIDLDWTAEDNNPLVLLLHGLEGNERSHYVRTLQSHLNQNGYQSVMMYFRGCSGEVNRRARAYHSGETGDLDFVVSHIRQRFPDRLFHAIGVSLGGNVLLKWLGETAELNPLSSAIAISVPFDLSNAANQLNNGHSRIYQRYLLNKLQSSLRQRLRHMALPINVKQSRACNTIRKYDELVTAPLHGFADADDYYTRSSSRQYLSTIHVPTLIVHSKDDPFMTEDAIPTIDELSDQVTLELTEKGGHVGFVSGHIPFLPHYWLEKRIVQFLACH